VNEYLTETITEAKIKLKPHMQKMKHKSNRNSWKQAVLKIVKNF